ncbi:hypothetical protein H6776_00690 [Candidatus Nomurabacteria bacterium]|nr:hypothetical protein [Candidatus Nomurabacteria bacterium]
MNWNNSNNKQFVEAILLLQTPEEAQAFLRDLLTEGEINEFGKRLQVAHMLTEKVPYSQIEKETGLSSATVARVSKWLNDGMGGYKAMLSKMIHHHLSSEMEKGLSSS